MMTHDSEHYPYPRGGPPHEVAALYTWKNPALARAVLSYYDRYFPAERLWKWCATPEGSHQEFCFFLNNQPVARHFTTDTSEHLIEAIHRNRVERIELGDRVDPQGESLARRVAFDLDSTDYNSIYPGDGDTTAPEGGELIKEGAWIMMVLSAGFLGQYLHKVLRFGNVTGDILKDYTFVFSGRRGVHLWVNHQERDWVNHEEIKALATTYIGRLATVAGARAAYNVISQPEHELAEWLSLVEEYGMAAMTSATDALWQRSHETIKYLKHELSVLFGTEIESSSTFFRALNAKGLVTSEMWCLAGLLLLAPRIDKSVTTSKGHLLKAPFSMHPSTRLVALPINPYLPSTSVRDNVCISIDRLVGSTPTPFLIRSFNDACTLFYPDD